MLNVAFAKEQRLELQTIGLLPEQADELEQVALPSVRAFLRRQPQKNDVRDKLAATAKALKAAEDAIRSLLRASMAYPAHATEVLPADAALARVLMASFDAGANGDVLDRAMLPISAAIHVVERALKTLPERATRHRTGSGYPVQLIDRALLHGFLKAHGHWPGTVGPNAPTPLPQYLIKRSYAPGSDYLRIIEICYEAAGAGKGSRERAIREFMESWKRPRTEPTQEI